MEAIYAFNSEVCSFVQQTSSGGVVTNVYVQYQCADKLSGISSLYSDSQCTVPYTGQSVSSLLPLPDAQYFTLGCAGASPGSGDPSSVPTLSPTIKSVSSSSSPLVATQSPSIPLISSQLPSHQPSLESVPSVIPTTVPTTSAPSGSPVQSPSSVSPVTSSPVQSTVPSIAPVETTGPGSWLIGLLYFTSGCAGEPTLYEAAPLGVCIKTGTSSSQFTKDLGVTGSVIHVAQTGYSNAGCVSPPIYVNHMNYSRTSCLAQGGSRSAAFDYVSGPTVTPPKPGPFIT